MLDYEGPSWRRAHQHDWWSQRERQHCGPYWQEHEQSPWRPHWHRSCRSPPRDYGGHSPPRGYWGRSPPRDYGACAPGRVDRSSPDDLPFHRPPYHPRSFRSSPPPPTRRWGAAREGCGERRGRSRESQESHSRRREGECWRTETTSKKERYSARSPPLNVLDITSHAKDAARRSTSTKSAAYSSTRAGDRETSSSRRNADVSATRDGDNASTACSAETSSRSATISNAASNGDTEITSPSGTLQSEPLIIELSANISPKPSGQAQSSPQRKKQAHVPSERRRPSGSDSSADHADSLTQNDAPSSLRAASVEQLSANSGSSKSPCGHAKSMATVVPCTANSTATDESCTNSMAIALSNQPGSVTQNDPTSSAHESRFGHPSGNSLSPSCSRSHSNGTVKDAETVGVKTEPATSDETTRKCRPSAASGVHINATDSDTRQSNEPDSDEDLYIQEEDGDWRIVLAEVNTKCLACKQKFATQEELELHLNVHSNTFSSANELPGLDAVDDRVPDAVQKTGDVGTKKRVFAKRLPEENGALATAFPGAGSEPGQKNRNSEPRFNRAALAALLNTGFKGMLSAKRKTSSDARNPVNLDTPPSVDKEPQSKPQNGKREITPLETSSEVRVLSDSCISRAGSQQRERQATPADTETKTVPRTKQTSADLSPDGKEARSRPATGDSERKKEKAVTRETKEKVTDAVKAGRKRITEKVAHADKSDRETKEKVTDVDKSGRVTPANVTDAYKPGQGPEEKAKGGTGKSAEKGSDAYAPKEERNHESASLAAFDPLMLTSPSAQLRGGRCEHKRDKVKQTWTAPTKRRNSVTEDGLDVKKSAKSRQATSDVDRKKDKPGSSVTRETKERVAEANKETRTCKPDPAFTKSKDDTRKPDGRSSDACTAEEKHKHNSALLPTHKQKSAAIKRHNSTETKDGPGAKKSKSQPAAGDVERKEDSASPVTTNKKVTEGKYKPGPACSKAGATDIKLKPACSRKEDTEDNQPGPAFTKKGDTVTERRYKPGPASTKRDGTQRKYKPGPAFTKTGTGDNTGTTPNCGNQSDTGKGDDQTKKQPKRLFYRCDICRDLFFLIERAYVQHIIQNHAYVDSDDEIDSGA